MPRPDRACPTDAVLAAVASGGVQEPLLDWYVSHLGSCDSCCDRIERLGWEAASLPAATRDAAVIPATDDDPEELAATLRQLKGLAPAFSGGREPSQPDASPALIGPFRVGRQIGAGATSLVYEAHDADLDRTVVLKVLLPTIGSDAAVRQALVDEARTLAAIMHPHVMPLYQLVWDHDTPVLVFPSLAGRTLEDAIASGMTDWRRAVAIVRDVAEAVEFVHGRGIVHRDIKPSNIWLHRTADGRESPLLFDFGLAGVRLETAGTPGYRRPADAGAEDDARGGDVFSLGVVLYEMTRSCPGAPPAVHDLVVRLLATTPGEQRTAAWTRSACEAILAGGGRRAAIGWLAAAAAGACAGAVGWAWNQPVVSAGVDAPQPLNVLTVAPGGPFCITDDARWFGGVDPDGTVFAEPIGEPAGRVRLSVAFRPDILAMHASESERLVAVAGQGSVVVIDCGTGTVRASYTALGSIERVAWAGSDSPHVLALADGVLLQAQAAGGTFPDALTPVAWWQNWDGKRDPVCMFTAASGFDLVAALLPQPVIHIWSLCSSRRVGLFLIGPFYQLPAQPTLMKWRSLDAFYIIRGRRASSCHVLSRMTEEVELPVHVADLAWLDGDLLVFVAADGARAGQVGCMVQSKPHAVAWLDDVGGEAVSVDAIGGRRRLVVGTDDGRVRLYDGEALKAWVMGTAVH